MVDDRTDVWADPDSGHVLKVVPWQPYRDGGARQAKHNVWTQAVSEKELVRVRNAIERIRGDVYQVSIHESYPERANAHAHRPFLTLHICATGVVITGGARRPSTSDCDLRWMPYCSRALTRTSSSSARRFALG